MVVVSSVFVSLWSSFWLMHHDKKRTNLNLFLVQMSQYSGMMWMVENKLKERARGTQQGKAKVELFVFGIIARSSSLARLGYLYSG